VRYGGDLTQNTATIAHSAYELQRKGAKNFASEVNGKRGDIAGRRRWESKWNGHRTTRHN